MSNFSNFIPENVALLGANSIGVYDSDNNCVGRIPIGNLRAPDARESLYSFGALSDIHIKTDRAKTNFRSALEHFNSLDEIMFTCICGDIIGDCTKEEWDSYKELVDTYSGGKPIYAMAGNHERYDGYDSDLEEGQTKQWLIDYTGHDLYYSFAYGEDVFVMLGCYSYDPDSPRIFTTESLQWLYETLEANRNKRCFVFEHVTPTGDSGDGMNLITKLSKDMFAGTANKDVFLSIMRHYKNAILFHGHSHLKFSLQSMDKKANYNEGLGFRSVHIPALAIPKDIAQNTNSSTNVEYPYIYKSTSNIGEGYVVDVYSKGIHLRGRDFYNNQYLPIASYWIDTSLVDVEAGTFVDTTGTIITNT